MPRRFWEYISRSTLKRETAVAVFVWWAGVGTGLMFRISPTQLAQDAALQAWGALAIPVFSFLTLAFGSDWASKQTTLFGPPINTETTVKTEVTDTTATVTTTSEPKP
jgi:hypothetical protein